MLILFWEDHYRKHPLDAKRTATGEVFFNTGDPLLDKWEREIAMGLEPDLLEGLPPEEREREKRALARLVAQKNQTDQANSTIGDGFTENYESALAELPVLGSRVPRGRFNDTVQEDTD